METPVPTSFPRRHKFIFGVIVTIGVLIYVAFNVWVYRSATSGSTPSPKEFWQTVTKSSAGFQAMTGPGPVITSSSPIPTPRLTGPGSYACDMFGVCNFYEDTNRAGCPKTYADRSCLNACENKDVRCKN